MVNLVIKVNMTSISKREVLEVIDKAKAEYNKAEIVDLLEGIEIKNTDTFHSGPTLLATVSVEHV